MGERTRPYVIQKWRVDKSPFRGNMKLVRDKISQYSNPKTRSKVGFTFTSSLKSMGLIPRSDGSYKLGDKYTKH
jgi:hypothetical protein